MTFLSQLILKRPMPPTAMHAYVESLFTDRKRHLFHVDRRNGRQICLILSEQKPNAAFAKFAPLSIQTKDFKPVLKSLSTGQQLHFTLTANPAKSAGHHRYSLTKSDDQLRWLQKRSLQNGFAIADSCIKSHKNVQIKHRGCKPINFGTVTYEGILQITDLNRFKQALITGIGPEKAYGMGMLLIRK